MRHDLLASSLTEQPSTLLVVLALALCAAAYVAARRRRRTVDPAPIGTSVAVAVSRPRSARPLGDLAAAVATPDRGRVVAVTILPPEAENTSHEAAEETIRTVHAMAGEGGLPTEGVVRVADDVGIGLLNAILEEECSLVLLGWPAEGREDGRLSGAVRAVVDQATSPTLVARLAGGRWDRIVIRAGGTRPAAVAAQRLACTVVARLAKATRTPAVVAGELPPSVDAQLPKGIVRSGQSAGEDPIGEPGALTVVPTDPDAMAHVLEWVEPGGDVLLVLPHGPSSREQQTLTPSAAGLYEASEGVR